MLRVVLAAGVVVFATGCGVLGLSAEPSVTPAPSVSAPPADGGAFATPADIMAKAGTVLPCTDASPMTPIGAKAQTVCNDGDLVIRVYEDHSGIDEQVDTLGMMGDVWLLTGENWSVHGPKETLEAARVKLGGQMIYVECKSHC